MTEEAVAHWRLLRQIKKNDNNKTNGDDLSKALRIQHTSDIHNKTAIMNTPMSPGNQQDIWHSIRPFHVYKRVKYKTKFSNEYNQNAFTYLVAVIDVNALQIFIRR
jgi:hypothetical protein